MCLVTGTHGSEGAGRQQCRPATRPPGDSYAYSGPYARVSPRDQHLDAQTDAREAAGCDKVFVEHGVIDPYVHTESRSSGRTGRLIIDEADRLKTTGLAHVRDDVDRHHRGVILIGMPGIEKRRVRYPQLYNRIGFAHE